MKKFPKVKYPDDSATDGLFNGEVVVTEKLDGANFRFGWRDGELKVGTRNVEYDDPFDENRPSAFEHAIDYVDEREAFGCTEGLVFFGEAMHLHSLRYQDVDYVNPASGSPYFKDAPNVVLFDVWDEQDNTWLDWGAVKGWSAALDIPHTRVIERGDPDDLDFEVPDESMFGGKPEGIVARRVDGEVRAKKVTEQFKEKNAVAFDDPTKAQSDAAEFVAAYITQPRIESVAHKLVDEGGYDELQMEMMQDLPREVIADAMAEEGWNLMTSGGFEGVWGDDFKGEVRSKTSKKCARALKKELNSF